MSGGGRRGRRGGRRQRRREEQARAQQAAQPTNGGPVHPVPPEPEAPVAPAPAPEAPAHPRPMSARELVARLEAMRAHEAAAGTAVTEDVPGADDDTVGVVPGASALPEIAAPAEPRRFAARGTEWLAHVAGRGAGGTGRVASARLEAVRFANAADPERVAAEVIVARIDLDALYDEELAELLERGLRSRTGND